MKTTPSSGPDFERVPAQPSARRLRMAVWLWVVVAASAVGCGGGEEPAEANATEKKGVTLPAKLTFVVTNGTDETLTDVMVEGFSYNVKFSSLPSGRTKSLLGNKPMDLESRMRVSWAGPNGGRRTDRAVSGKIPKNFNGKVYFTITGKGKVEYRGGTL